MTAISRAAPVSRNTLRAGRIVTAIPILFLVFDGATKVMRTRAVLDAFAQTGWSRSLAPVIGAILLICVVIYAIPRSAVLGAILLTGYLGGAVATNLRLGTPLFTYTLFPVYLGILVWGGIFLREPRLRSLVPLRD